MNKEMLSQEEIDALLKQGENDDDAEEGGNVSSNNGGGDKLDLNKYLTPFDQDALGEIGNITFGSASTALSTLLGQKVEITTPKIYVIEKKDLHKEFPTPHVAVHVEYTTGFKGVNLFVIRADDAKIIADLMLGGNGEEIKGTDLTEMDISAVQEAMNQMMGSAATSMSTIFNTAVNISPPSVDIFDLEGSQEEKEISEEIIIIVSFRLKIGDLIDSNIMQLTSVSFAKDMINKLLGSSDEEEIEEETEIDFPMDEIDASTPSPSPSTTPPPQRQEGSMEQERVASYQQPPSNIKSSQSVNPNVDIHSAQFADFGMNQHITNQDPNLGLLMDIPLQITVELGRTKKLIKDILELAQGSVLELDKLAGEPVDIFANNKLIAKGEVVVIDENFGVRVTDIISQYDRVRKLQ